MTRLKIKPLHFILFVLGIQVSLIDSPMLVLGAALSRDRTREYFPAVITGQRLVNAFRAAS